MQKVITLLFFTFSFLLTGAQVRFARYFGNDDLTCNLITEITQDQEGFIWIGTINGLNRYDGWSFRHIYANADDSTSLLSNYIYELFMDSRGRLWVGTNMGVQYYDSNTDTFRTINFPGGRFSTSEQMVELSNGELWFINDNIFRIDSETMRSEPLEDLNKLTSSSVTEAFVDSKGGIWLASSRNTVFHIAGGGIEILDTDGRLSSFVERDGNIYAASRNAVYVLKAGSHDFEIIENDCEPYTRAKLLKSHDGNIYLATNGQGFRVLDTETTKILSYDKFVSKDVDLNDINTEDWMEDISGRIWISSSFNGVVMIDNETAEFTSIGPHEINIPYNDMVNAVYLDGKGRMWSGTERGELYSDENRTRMVEVQTLPGSIYSIFETDGSSLLVGTRLQGLYKLDRDTGRSRLIKGTEGLYVKKIDICPDGNLVLALFSQGIAFFNPTTEVVSGNIRAGTVNTVLCDRDGLVWCGTYGGIRCYNYEDGTEESIPNFPDLSASVVYSLYEGQDSKIWMGTSDGLFSYDKATDSYEHYGAEGLRNNVICGIAGDREGNIWASTFKGIVRLEPESGRTDSFSSGHGLSDTEYIRGSYWHDRALDVIFFGGQHEITAFEPARIASAGFATAPALTGLWMKGAYAAPASLRDDKRGDDGTDGSYDVLNLPVGARNIFLRFSTMDFRETDFISTEYCLDNSDGFWSRTSPGSNTILIESLKPGRHILKVRFNEIGTISPEREIILNVAKPWYATRFAYIIYLLAVLLAGYSIFHLIRKVSIKAAAEKAERKKLEFLTNLTREIRTPMTLVMTPLQKLARNGGDGSEGLGDELKSARANAEKVVSLLDQSLNVTRIDEDGSDMKFSEVDMISFISNLLDGFEYATSMKDIDLVFNHEAEELKVWIDRNRFENVILNLVSNAIKATPQGGKVIVEAGKSGRNAELMFKDSGNSLDEEQMSRMFELEKTAGTGGTAGIEMYLCRQVVTQHKGTISVANRTDAEGICYTVRIPLGYSHIPKDRMVSAENIVNEALNRSFYYSDNKESDEGSESSQNKRYSIIAIDENEDICKYLSKLLSEKFNISTFTSAAEGCQAAINDVPDLIITDMAMPEMDGITVVRKIKGNLNTAHVPVLLLTAIPGESMRLEGLMTGADAILTKPFNEEELLLVCTNLIMSRSRLASHIKDMQVSKEMLQKVDLKSNNDILMQKVITVINDNISNPDLNVEMMADTIGISRGHLHRKIKEITGSSPGEYIRAIRLNQAAQLLKGDKKNISQIAYSVGYNNPSVFSTAFKTFFGMSAKEYQKRYANTENTGQQDD